MEPEGRIKRPNPTWERSQRTCLLSSWLLEVLYTSHSLEHTKGVLLHEPTDNSTFSPFISLECQCQICTDTGWLKPVISLHSAGFSDHGYLGRKGAYVGWAATSHLLQSPWLKVTNWFFSWELRNQNSVFRCEEDHPLWGPQEGEGLDIITVFGSSRDSFTVFFLVSIFCSDRICMCVSV